MADRSRPSNAAASDNDRIRRKTAMRAKPTTDAHHLVKYARPLDGERDGRKSRHHSLVSTRRPGRRHLVHPSVRDRLPEVFVQMSDDQQLHATVRVIPPEELGCFGRGRSSSQWPAATWANDCFKCSITLAFSVTVFSMSRVDSGRRL